MCTRYAPEDTPADVDATADAIMLVLLPMLLPMLLLMLLRRAAVVCKRGRVDGVVTKSVPFRCLTCRKTLYIDWACFHSLAAAPLYPDIMLHHRARMVRFVEIYFRVFFSSLEQRRRGGEGGRAKVGSASKGMRGQLPND